MSKASAGKRIVAGLGGVLASLKSGGLPEVERRFKTGRVKRAELQVPGVASADVRGIRGKLDVSQDVFAGLLGVSTNTVRAWEQGVNPLSKIAARFLDEVNRNPEYWKQRVEELAFV